MAQGTAKAYDDERLNRMREHVISQLVLTLTLVGLGMGYATYVSV